MKWLEDFVLLAQIKNFSKTAEMRNVTQPAFSRRIQALETWLGVSLIDRTSFPTSLTPAGEVFLEQAHKMLEQLRETRTMLKGHSLANRAIIEFAVPHNLSLTFFPEWIMKVAPLLGNVSYRLRALNVHDAVMTLINGSCDLLMAYYHPSQTLQLEPEHYDMVVLGMEKIAPYSLATPQGTPHFSCAQSAADGAALPLLAYTNNAYLGKIVEFILSKQNKPLSFKTIYETDMAEGLKSMMMAGHGLAFLPESSVKNELAQGTVVKANDAHSTHLEIDLEIRLYQQKPNPLGSPKVTALHGDRSQAGQKTQSLSRLWQSLAAGAHNTPVFHTQRYANYA